jgi:hypothetical protein
VVEFIEQWCDPLFNERHSDVPRPLAERLARMADEITARSIGRHVYYERLHALLALASIARHTDVGRFELEEPPSDPEKQLGASIGQAIHQGCTLADVVLATDLRPDQVVAIGKRTIRRTKWLDRL